MTKKIVAIGGGENGRITSDGTSKPYETGPIDQEIIHLTGKEKPHFLFLAHSQDTIENENSYFETMQAIYNGRFGCECKHLIKAELADIEYAKSLVNWADIIYEGGGNTLDMIKLWNDTGFDKILYKAWNEGKVLCGLSAGANCWFEACSSDSLQIKFGPDQPLISMECLGFLKGFLVPHCDEPGRTETAKEFIKEKDMIGLFLSNCSALEIIDDTYRVIYGTPADKTFKPYAIKAYWQDEEYVEEMLKYKGFMMTSEAQSILNQVKSIADSPDIFEIKKVNSIIDILQDTDWNILEEAYDELLKIIFSFENNHGPSRGGLYGHLLKKKVNAEHSSLKGDEHYNYIENNIQSIINNTAFRQEGKTWAIVEGFGEKSDISISVEEFYRICKLILNTDDQILNFNEKINILSKIGLKVSKTQPNIAQMFQRIIDVEAEERPLGVKYDFCTNIWQGLENNSNKVSQLAQVYNAFSNTKYIYGRNEKALLLSLIKPLDSKAIVENIDILLSQISSIECDRSFKQIAMAKLYLSVDRTEENVSVLSRLRDEIEKIQQSDKDEKYHVFGDIREDYDVSTPEKLMDSIVYQELADITIIDDWATKSDIQKRNIINSIESLLQSNDSRYAEDGYIMRFIQLCKHKVIRMEDEDTKHLISVYDTYLSGIDNTNSLDVYERLIGEGGGIDFLNYHDFETQVVKYRCKGARLPRTIYNYILKESLSEWIDRIDQALLIQSAIIDLTYDNLECIGEPDYFVYFRGNMVTTYGSQSKGFSTIKYNVDAFNPRHWAYEQGLGEFVATAFHEPRHRWQDFARTKGYLNKRIYKISQEEAIIECDYYFYKAHYSEMEEEIDARIFEKILTTQYLLELGFSTSEIAAFIKNTLDTEIARDKEFNRGVKKNFDGKDMTTVEMLQQVFSSNPNKNIINRIFERNPLLSLEYRIVYSDEDELKCNVERRSNEEIEYIHQLLLSRISDEEDKKNVDELFDYIINGEKESKHSEFTTGEYLHYYGYDANWSMKKLSRMSPCLCDYQLFKGQVNNELVEPFPGTVKPIDQYDRPEV